MNTHIILETNEFADILQYITPQNAQNSLVILDIDNTLGHTKSPDGVGTYEWYHQEVKKLVNNGMQEDEAALLAAQTFVAAQLKYDLEPVEPQTADIFRQLKETGATVIALTGRPLTLLHRTAEQLKNINIDFSTAKLPAYIELNVSNDVAFKDGILFVGPINDKGEYLHKFLHYIDQHFTRIIFLDDQQEYIDQVEQSFDNIPEFIGLRYGRLDHLIHHHLS